MGDRQLLIDAARPPTNAVVEIALHDDHGGFRRAEHVTHAGHQPGRQSLEALRRLHHVEIVVRRDAEHVQNLVQQSPMLTTDADLALDFRDRPSSRITGTA